MNSPRLVLFDLDDTIADTSGTILKLAERSATEALIAHGLQTNFDEAWAALRRIRSADPGARFLEDLVAQFGAPDPVACHDAARRVFFASRPEEIGLVPGALEVLDELRARGIPLILVTFGVPEAQSRKVEVLGIRDRFEAVHIVPLDEGPDKTAVFAEIVDGNGCAPADVWVVGDRPPGEVKSGNLLGLTTIRVRRGEFATLDPASTDEEPDVTIDDLRKLTALLP
ncbi:MAG: HAD family hydrolase [Planctomycetota bacterium]